MNKRNCNRGFTIIEMLVVLTIIALIAAIVIPSTANLLRSGEHAHSYNLLAGQIRAARALALENNDYTAIHTQRATATAKLANSMVSYVAVMSFSGLDNDTNGVQGAMLDLADGFTPEKIPGTISFANMSDNTFYDDFTNNFDPPGPIAFNTSTIIFTPDGGCVRDIQQEQIFLNQASPLVTGAKPIWTASRNTWSSADTSYLADGCFVLALTDTKWGHGSDLARNLNESGRFITINRTTGLLMPWNED